MEISVLMYETVIARISTVDVTAVMFMHTLSAHHDLLEQLRGDNLASACLP